MPGEALAVLFVPAVVVGACREEQDPAGRPAEAFREGEDLPRGLRCIVGMEQFVSVDAPGHAVVKKGAEPFSVEVVFPDVGDDGGAAGGVDGGDGLLHGDVPLGNVIGTVLADEAAEGVIDGGGGTGLHQVAGDVDAVVIARVALCAGKGVKARHADQVCAPGLRPERRPRSSAQWLHCAGA